MTERDDKRSTDAEGAQKSSAQKRRAEKPRPSVKDKQRKRAARSQRPTERGNRSESSARLERSNRAETRAHDEISSVSVPGHPGFSVVRSNRAPESGSAAAGHDVSYGRANTIGLASYKRSRSTGFPSGAVAFGESDSVFLHADSEANAVQAEGAEFGVERKASAPYTEASEDARSASTADAPETAHGSAAIPVEAVVARAAADGPHEGEPSDVRDVLDAAESPSASEDATTSDAPKAAEDTGASGETDSPDGLDATSETQEPGGHDAAGSDAELAQGEPAAPSGDAKAADGAGEADGQAPDEEPLPKQSPELDDIERQRRRSAARRAAQEAEAARRNAKRRRRLIVLASVAAVLVTVAGILSWQRWWQFDDAADIQGSWEAAQSKGVAHISINEHVLQLSSDVAYSYTLDTTAKTITYTFGDMEGHGRYWFSADRDTLVIVDGDSYSTLSTFVEDIEVWWRDLFALVQGQEAQGLNSFGSVRFVRVASDAPAAQNTESQQAPTTGAPANLGAIADVTGTDENGANAASEPTGEAPEGAAPVYEESASETAAGESAPGEEA